MKQITFRGQLHRLELNHGKSYTEEQSQFLWADLQHLSDETFATTVQRLLDSREDRGLPAKADFVRASEGKARKPPADPAKSPPPTARPLTRLDLEAGAVWREFLTRWLVTGSIIPGPDHVGDRPRSGEPNCFEGDCPWCDQYREVTQIVARLAQDPALHQPCGSGAEDALAATTQEMLAWVGSGLARADDGDQPSGGADAKKAR